MNQTSRAEWLALGAVTLAGAATAHAMAGAAAIARDILRGEADGSTPASSSATTGNRPPGWVLFWSVILAGAAVHHVVVDAGGVIKEILRPTPSL